MKYQEAFIKHLKEKLVEINPNLNYIINWHVDIEKRKTRENEQVDLNSNDIFIVLSLMPSQNYGDGTIMQQIEMTALCMQNRIDELLNVLAEYQSAAINKRYWEKTTMIDEAWYSPTIAENLVALRVGKGAVLSMTGTVAFSEDIVTLDKLYLCGEEHKYVQFYDSATADTLPNATMNDPRKKNINRSIFYKLDLKVKNTNSVFCQNARKWKYKNNLNIIVPVKLLYTDGEEIEINTVFNSVVFNIADGNISTITVSLVEAMQE